MLLHFEQGKNATTLFTSSMRTKKYNPVIQVAAQDHLICL